LSVYAQDGLPLGDRVTANVGVRLDRYGLVISAAHLSPRVNLAYQAGAGTVVSASYNHFFVPPPVEGVLSTSGGLTSRIREVGVALPALEATVEDQFELGASAPVGPVQLGVTGYYRATDNPVHTTVWPDSRIYSYASFDHARAYGLEMKADLTGVARRGMTGFLNYALGRVDFYNPVTGGFVVEAEHLTSSSRFLAPMDQTHTVTGGVTYRHYAHRDPLGEAFAQPLVGRAAPAAAQLVLQAVRQFVREQRDAIGPRQRREHRLVEQDAAMASDPCHHARGVPRQRWFVPHIQERCLEAARVGEQAERGREGRKTKVVLEGRRYRGRRLLIRSDARAWRGLRRLV